MCSELQRSKTFRALGVQELFTVVVDDVIHACVVGEDGVVQHVEAVFVVVELWGWKKSLI